MKKKVIFLLGIIFLIPLVLGYDCKIEGCPSDFRCMANGECTPLLVEEYCEDHGKPSYLYDDFLLARNCTQLMNLKEERLCLQCQADYGLKKSVSDIENIIFGIAAGLAILMISLNGIKLMGSQDAGERENAKKGIIYIIFALIVIVTITKLVEYLLM